MAFVQNEAIAEPGAVRFVVDQVEALVELGRRDEAVELLDWYEGNARRLERASALAHCARCRGLLAAQAGELDEALARLRTRRSPGTKVELPARQGRGRCSRSARRSGVRSAAARRERRSRRRSRLFERIGAALWAERARAELRRISGRAGDGRAHARRGADRRARRRGQDEPRGGGRALPLRAHGRGPPLARLRKARRPLAHRARSRQSSSGPHGVARQTRVIPPFQPNRPLPSLDSGGQGVTGTGGEGAMTRRISLITAVAGLALVLPVPVASGQGEPVQDLRTGDQRQDVQRPIVSPTPSIAQSRCARPSSRVGAASCSTTIASRAGRRAQAAASCSTTTASTGARPEQVSATSSGREIEWPQLGIGFGIGIALMLGLGWRCARRTRGRWLTDRVTLHARRAPAAPRGGGGRSVPPLYFAAWPPDRGRTGRAPGAGR